MRSRLPLPLSLALVAALALALTGCLGVEQSFEGPPTESSSGSAEEEAPAESSADEAAGEDAAGDSVDQEDEAETEAEDAADAPAGAGPLELPIGAAFALTGPGSSFGRKGEAALALAEEMLAEGFGELVAVPPIEVRDTETSPDKALELVQAMHEEGIRIVIGPQTSANTAAVKDFADENGMILISPSSVARALSIPDDNVFRMTPDDSLQAEAMTTMLEEDGLSKVFLVHRDDLWGEDLAGLVAETLEAEGAIELDLRSYDSAGPDAAALVSDLAADAEAAVAELGAEAVGVYLLSFGEGAGILAAASAQPGLDALRWYGSSAVAQSSDYLSDPAVVAFAQKVGYPSPVFGLDPSHEGALGADPSGHPGAHRRRGGHLRPRHL